MYKHVYMQSVSTDFLHVCSAFKEATRAFPNIQPTPNVAMYVLYLCKHKFYIAH